MRPLKEIVISSAPTMFWGGTFLCIYSFLGHRQHAGSSQPADNCKHAAFIPLPQVRECVTPAYFLSTSKPSICSSVLQAEPKIKSNRGAFGAPLAIAYTGHLKKFFLSPSSYSNCLPYSTWTVVLELTNVTLTILSFLMKMLPSADTISQSFVQSVALPIADYTCRP